MTMYALQRRLTDSGITVSSLHPGTVGYNMTMIATTYIASYVETYCMASYIA